MITKRAILRATEGGRVVRVRDLARDCGWSLRKNGRLNARAERAIFDTVGFNGEYVDGWWVYGARTNLVGCLSDGELLAMFRGGFTAMVQHESVELIDGLLLTVTDPGSDMLEIAREIRNAASFGAAGLARVRWRRAFVSRALVGPIGRTFAACSLAPQVIVSDEPGEVTCARCRYAIRRGAERARPIPQLARVGGAA